MCGGCLELTHYHFGDVTLQKYNKNGEENYVVRLGEKPQVKDEDTLIKALKTSLNPVTVPCRDLDKRLWQCHYGRA